MHIPKASLTTAFAIQTSEMDLFLYMIPVKHMASSDTRIRCSSTLDWIVCNINNTDMRHYDRNEKERRPYVKRLCT